MRLLVVGLNFAPEPIGVGKYTGEMAAWLAARGHEMVVVTAPPYYPWWRHCKNYSYWRWNSEIWRSCRVTRCPIYVPHRVNGWRRILHLVSFAVSAIPATLCAALYRKPDVLIAVVPTLLSAPIALVTARLVGARAWLHIQDLEFDAGHELYGAVLRPLMRIAFAAERWMLRRFDVVSSISPKMLKEIEQRGVKPERLVLFTNWVDMSTIFPLPPSVSLRRELGIAEDRCIVLYSGSMGEKQGLETVLAAARLLAADRTSPSLFVLAGEGHARRRFETEAHNLPNVIFLPVQPEERFNEFLNFGDIHLLPQRSAVADLVLPSKLCAILAAGKPLIATVTSDTQIAQIIGPAGAIVPPDDPGALATAIRALAGDLPRRQAMGDRAFKIAQDMFDRETVLVGMEERLRNEIELPVAPSSIVH